MGAIARPPLPPPPAPSAAVAAAVRKAPTLPPGAASAAAARSSFADPRGVASVPLRVPEEIATVPAYSSAAAASAAAIADSEAAALATTSSWQANERRAPVLYAFPAPRGDKRPSRVLSRVLSAHTLASSSAAHMAAHEAAVAGLGPRARAARTLKRRADDARVQQLRGIFAGHDSDRDGIVNDKCVACALLGRVHGARPPLCCLGVRSRMDFKPHPPLPCASGT